MSHPPERIDARHKPRLALVLGSGGVQSIAALGVADVLRKAGIGIDLVVGCSAGALFGAGIAMGWSTEDALERYTRLWARDLTEQRRWWALAQLLAPRWAGFGPGFSLRDPSKIRRAIETGFEGARFETLQLPLRVVATDAATGQRVVLSSGVVADALRASLALPFLFPSVPIDGRRLVDGVLSDPLPVSVAQDADVVLSLATPGEMPRRVDRASRLLAQVSTTLINNLQAAHLQAAKAYGQCVLPIELPLDRRIGLWETSALPYLFDLGRRAAVARLPRLVELLGHSRAAMPHPDTLSAVGRR